MDKLEHYRSCVLEVLRKYHDYASDRGQVEMEDQLIVDREHDHYQLLRVGWEDEHRVYGCPLHLDIKNGKVWIQCDFIDIEGGIAGELMELGVPKEDIVLAFHAPYKRPYTGFAVA